MKTYNNTTSTTIKLIACDLDGTLLRNEAQTLNPEVFNLILRLKEKGILFVAASGRQHINLQRLFAPVKDDIAYIAENGALCIYQDQLLRESYIERSIGEDILLSIREQNDCEILLSGRHQCYLESHDSHYIDHMKYIVKNDVALVTDILSVTEPYLKISVCDFRGISHSEAYFKERFGDVVNVVTSGNIWLDMISKETNKATALKCLVSHLGLSSDVCAAFGDNYNDVQMLQYVKESYAVDTAQPGIAELCKYTTKLVEDELKKMAE